MPNTVSAQRVLFVPGHRLLGFLGRLQHTLSTSSSASSQRLLLGLLCDLGEASTCCSYPFPHLYFREPGTSSPVSDAIVESGIMCGKCFINHKELFIFISIILMPSSGFHGISQMQINTPRDTELPHPAPFNSEVFFQVSAQTALPREAFPD